MIAHVGRARVPLIDTAELAALLDSPDPDSRRRLAKLLDEPARHLWRDRLSRWRDRLSVPSRPPASGDKRDGST
jgi:hypothetical protein